MGQDMKGRLSVISDRCKRKGVCRNFCDLIDSLGDTTPGDIAENIIKSKTDSFLTDFVFKCSLCGLCREYCTHDVDIPDMVRTLKGHLFKTGTVDPEIYRPLFVDHDWNFFSIYRDSYEIEQAYSDLFREKCDVLFFPGCTLANESVDLVRRSVSWMADTFGNARISLTLLCCGAPLHEMGLEERFFAFTEYLSQIIHDSGAGVLVTACPSCHLRLSTIESVSDIQIISLYELLREKGVKVDGSDSHVITVHDACPARYNNIGAHVRGLLTDYTIREMKHSGKKTICCGSGGLVSAYDRETCKKRAQNRMQEVEKTQAEICVTYCMACTHRLSAEKNDVDVRHILEMIFKKHPDRSQYNKNIEMMWQGDLGDRNAELLLNSTLLNMDEREG